MNDHGSRNYTLLQSLSGQVEDLLSGRISMSFHTSTAPSASLRTMDPTAAISAAGAAEEHAPQASYEACSSASTVGMGNATSLDPSAPAPQYRMSRTIITVNDLWQEWTVGLGLSPSIQALEGTYGAKWRASQSEKVFFIRRKVIIQEVQRRQAYQASIQAAVEELEFLRRKSQLTLHGLWKWLVQVHAGI